MTIDHTDLTPIENLRFAFVHGVYGKALVLVMQLDVTVSFDDTRIKPRHLGAAWDATTAMSYDFVEVVNHFVPSGWANTPSCIECDDCHDPTWADDSHTTAAGATICEGCVQDYFWCEGCEELFHGDNITSVGDTIYCDARCLSRYCHWCGDCDEWDTESHDHDEGCDCEAPHQSFRFPANGHGTVQDDERLLVELPAGTIADEGIKAITALLVQAFPNQWALWGMPEQLDPRWQTKRGNYTRRLSSLAYKDHGVKLPASLVTEVGNLARQHTSDGATWHVEFTRDLNQEPGEFAHDDSCWWGSFSSSRCCLKNWGGLAIRSYPGDHGYVTGRAWVQPLNEDLEPTHNAESAFAYVVYNGYGELEGYAPARIVAHLSGKTYRKVGLVASPQYINAGGYLVADQETCDNTAAIHYSAEPHHQLDADTFHRLENAA